MRCLLLVLRLPDFPKALGCQSLILLQTFCAVHSPGSPLGISAVSPVLAFYKAQTYPRALTLTLSPLPWKFHTYPVSADTWCYHLVPKAYPPLRALLKPPNIYPTTYSSSHMDSSRAPQLNMSNTGLRSSPPNLSYSIYPGMLVLVCSQPGTQESSLSLPHILPAKPKPP